MATIALYANKLNHMSGLVKDVKKAVTDYKTELSSLRKKALQINTSVCNLDDVISSIQASTQTQDEKANDLDELDRKNEQFIADTVRIDNEVADLVRQQKDDFYEKYSYLKPECEKNWIENNLDKAATWCKKHWESILSVVAIVIITIAAVAVCIATFGTVAVAVAVFVGLAVGVAGQFLSDCITSIATGEWNFSSWQTYVGAGLGGVAGALAFLVSGGNSVLASSVSGGVSTFFAQNLENITGGEKRSFLEIMVNTSISVGISALIAKFFPLKIQKLTAGRGNFDAVYRGILTKLDKGIIQHVSAKTIAKGVVSGIVGDFWQTLFWGTYEAWKEHCRQGWQPVRNSSYINFCFAD